MANSIYGQGHEDKDLDTSKKNLSQEMLMCNMKALIFLILLQIFFFFMISNVKVKRFRTNERNIHVKYENTGTHCWNVNSNIKVFRMYVKLQGQ